MTHPGQRLCIGITGTALTADTRQLLETVRPAGIILFTRNIDSSEQLHDLTCDLRALPSRPFIAVDQENKRVNRLRYVVGELPGLAEVKPAGQARELGRQIGRSLRDHGIDMDFAPVLDVETASDNALRERCWGKTPDEIIQHAGAFIAGLEEFGVRACGKHFPGLGHAHQDSHEVLPTVTGWDESELRPFAELKLPAIMVGHAIYPELDDRPASLSRKIITGLLRQKLGYRGLVITDDMEMGAIHDFEAAVVEAAAAGADIILVCHTPAKIMAAYECLHR